MDGLPEVREDEEKGRLAHREADEEDNALIRRLVSFLFRPLSPFFGLILCLAYTLLFSKPNYPLLHGFISMPLEMAVIIVGVGVGVGVAVHDNSQFEDVIVALIGLC